MHRHTQNDQILIYNMADQLELAAALVSRLERLSADSIWAHRASGVRGALLKSIDNLQTSQPEDSDELRTEIQRLAQSTTYGYWVLEKAARELIE